MTLVTIDLGDVAGGHHPDDHVIIRAENFRESQGGGITSTAEVKIPLVDGAGQAEVEPGPVVVAFRCQAVADTREKRGVVPDSGTVGVEDVLSESMVYTAPVVSRALATINGAVGEAVAGEMGQAVRQATASAVSAEKSAANADRRATSAETKVDAYTPRVEALEVMGGLAPGEPADGQTANLIEQGETLTRAAVESAAVRVVHQSLPEYIVGPTGEYRTVSDFFVDHPTGNATIVLQEGYHFVDPLPSDGSLKNFHMRGQGSIWGSAVRWPDAGTTVETTGPLVDSAYGTGNIRFSDFNLRHTEQTNNDDAIHVVYPQGLIIENLNIDGYGGTSIWFEGGSDSEAKDNYILARDHARTTGHAGIKVSARGGDYTTRSATTIHTTRNYVGSSGNYGYVFDGAVQGMISTSDIAEYCQLGFYFNRAPITVIAPYTEACDEGMVSLDCNPLILGSVRDELKQEWTSGSTSVFGRRATRVSTNWMDMGRGLIMGLAGGVSSGAPYGDFVEEMSIRAGTLAPNRYYTAPAGSLYFMKGGTFGKTLWQKHADGGNEGWLPVGNFTVSIEELTIPTSWLNANKYKGMTVWCHSRSFLVYASGSDPTDEWINVRTGEVEVTPA